MRYQKHGVSTAVDGKQQLHDLVRRLLIEISGGLVSKENHRVVYQGAGDGHALSLSAGQLTWQMLQAVLNAKKNASSRSFVLSGFLPSSSSGMMIFSSAVRMGIRLKS